MLMKCVFQLNRILRWLHNSFFDAGAKPGNFLDEVQTIEYLSSTRKSLIRWGDGESTILTGGNLRFQDNSADLWRELHGIVSAYNNESSYLIALPHRFLLETRSSLKKMHKYRMWGKTRYVYDRFFSKNSVKYLDAFSFREESALAPAQIEKLWRDEKRILFVNSDYDHFEKFKSAHQDHDVVFIEIKSTNSYGLLEAIIDNASRQMESRHWSPSECCALVSGGPAGKVMVFEFSRLGCRALDLGHYFDHKLRWS